jgi:hypothetical protein
LKTSEYHHHDPGNNDCDHPGSHNNSSTHHNSGTRYCSGNDRHSSGSTSELNDSSGIGKSKFPSNHGYGFSGSKVKLVLINAYGAWIQQYVDVGWDPYLVTFTFNYIPGSMDMKMRQMYKEVTFVYGRLLTRMIRRPRSPNWLPFLPRGVFLADLPVYKQEKQSLRNVVVNDGLHVGGIVLAHQWGRLQEPLDVHFPENIKVYQTEHLRCRKGKLSGAVESPIHVVPITHSSAYTTEYALKAARRDKISLADVLILPRVVGELTDRRSLHRIDPRP